MLIWYVAKEHNVANPVIVAVLVNGAKLVTLVKVGKLVPFRLGVTFTFEGKIFPFAEVKVIEFVEVVKFVGAGLPLYNQPLFAPRFHW